MKARKGLDGSPMGAWSRKRGPQTDLISLTVFQAYLDMATWKNKAGEKPVGGQRFLGRDTPTSNEAPNH